jgi:hypothetical protein
VAPDLAVDRVGLCDGPHDIQYVGYMGDGAKLGCSGCTAPVFVYCVRCAYDGYWACDSSRQSRCAPCARRYRHRVEMVCQSGMLGRVGFCLTLTAPGQNVHCFRHKRKGCTEDGCSDCPCTSSDGTDLRTWNVGLTARANRYLEAIRRGEASPLVKGRRQSVPLEYFQARELQRRGALHCHIPLVRADGKPLQLDKRQLRQLAMRHGFGHAMTYKPFTGGLANYCAKYVSKAADQRLDVPWLPECRNRRREATYRTWTRSRGYGKSMREVRQELCERVRQREEPKATLDSFRDSYARDGGTGPVFGSLEEFLEATGQNGGDCDIGPP